MHRNGNFVPKKKTDNQCKVNGHTSYNYNLKLIFPKTIELNAQKFIVDHQHIDRLIQSLGLKGSCEEMHLTICDAVRKFFDDLDCELLASKCRIQPDVTVGAAFLDYAYVKSNEYLFLTSLL